MLNYSLRTSTIVITGFTLVLMSGCGGGGSGSGNTNTIIYSGISTQAAISQTNGEEIASESFKNGSSGAVLSTTPLSIQIGQVSTRTQPRLYTLTKTLNKSLGQIGVNNSIPATVSGATLSQSDTSPGSCGGSGSYSITIDEVSGNFSGIFIFTNYCEDQEILSGTMTLAGTFNQSNSSLAQITMTFTNLTTTNANESTTLSGNITTPNLFASPAVLTANLIIKDNNIGQVYKTENLTISYYDGFTYEDLDLSGQFYIPDHGYITLTTPTSLRYMGTNNTPYPGVLVATGSSNTSATLTSLSTTTYQLDIDEDGDGISEFTDTGNWADL